MTCLEDYCSILLSSYSISTGALGSTDLLLSYSMITLSWHITINHTNNNPSIKFQPCPEQVYCSRDHRHTWLLFAILMPKRACYKSDASGAIRGRITIFHLQERIRCQESPDAQGVCDEDEDED